MAQAIRTTDHQEIKEWVETRGGSPAVLEGTHDEFGSGILRIDFGTGDESLEELSWEEFFRVFDANDLAFVYRDETEEGMESYVCAFVARNDDDADTEYEAQGDVLDELLSESDTDVSDGL